MTLFAPWNACGVEKVRKIAWLTLRESCLSHWRDFHVVIGHSHKHEMWHPTWTIRSSSIELRLLRWDRPISREQAEPTEPYRGHKKHVHTFTPLPSPPRPVLRKLRLTPDLNPTPRVVHVAGSLSVPVASEENLDILLFLSIGGWIWHTIEDSGRLGLWVVDSSARTAG